MPRCGSCDSKTHKQWCPVVGGEGSQDFKDGFLDGRLGRPACEGGSMIYRTGYGKGKEASMVEVSKPKPVGGGNFNYVY